MTKTFLKISFVAAVALLAASCKKNNYVTDQEIVAPAFAKFNVKQTADTSATYYVRSTQVPFKIPVGITSPSNVDRTIQFSYSSNDAVSGVQYTAPSSIVIPAGQTLDSLEITGLYAAFANPATVDTLFIKITGGDVPVSSYWKGYRLLMRKYCDVVLPALEGVYDNTNEYSAAGAFSYGPYTTAISGLTSTGPTSATGYISNIYDFGWADIQVNLDWSNDGAFRVSIPLQPTGGGGATYVRSSATGPNTFSSCTQTFNLSIDLLNASQAVTTTGYQVRLAR